MKHTLLFSTLIGLLLVSACKKDNNDPYPGQPTVKYQMVATNKDYAVARTTATANLTWTTAIAYPGTVKFEAKQDNVHVEFKSTNNAPIDLMSSTAVTFGNFTIPPGTYDEIELKIYLDKTGSNPVLRLTGQVSSTTVTLPVVVEVTRSILLKTEQHDVTITSDADYTAVTTLDLYQITSGISADMLLNAQLSGGVILISANENQALYNKLLANLEYGRHKCRFDKHHRK